MQIDFLDNSIIISAWPKLKTSHLSQIHFFGFVKGADGSYKVLSPDLGSVAQKLIKYLKKGKINYSSTDKFNAFFEKYNKRLNDFEFIKTKCRNYKDGLFNGQEIKEFNSFVKMHIPRKLRDHQLKAAYHLYLAGNAANFSVPGSGKTSVVLAVYEKLRLEDKVNLLFIVGPPSCFWPWKTEFYRTFNREPNFKILSGGDHRLRKQEYYNLSGKKELYLTTYQTLLNDQEEIIKFFGQIDLKVFLVIDEAHYMKQIGGNWARAILRVANYVQYRCILTGTPLPKSFADAFNLFDFLWPQHNPINSKTKSLIYLKEKEHDGVTIKRILDDAIGPLFYRVRKSELGLLPPAFHPPKLIKMNKYERLIYDAIESKIRNYAKSDYLSNISLVAQLSRGRMIRLRQCISYAKLLLTSVESYREDMIGKDSCLRKLIIDYDKKEIPAKLEYLTDFVIGMQKRKQKLIIWANFVGTLELIGKHLRKSGFYCKLIYGKTPFNKDSIVNEVKEEESREKIRNEFVDKASGLDILIANPAACAESISLHTTCFNALYYDLSYNCAQYLQSLDRIHRVGGSEHKKANYYFFQYENTLDQDIKANLDAKALKMSSVIDEDYAIYSLDMFEDSDDIMAYERLFKKPHGRI